MASRHSYGDHPSQFGELHEGGEDVAVLVHGGFWRARYGLDLEHELAADLAGRGWTVWNIEYRRLGDGGGWPETGADVVSAIEALPVAAARIVAIGHSAGGHLAAWASAHTRLDGVVSQAGALDLYDLHRRGTSDHVVRQLLGGSPDEVPERYAAATPRPPAGMPLLLVHGVLDEDVPVELSRDFGAGDVVIVPDEGHMEHLDPRSQCWRAVIEWL
ncbi:MAG TPA: prolyl oligopeptidase family serine peptidase [Solirubrobacteraceae bacterium]|nr:prolyl oligopeptidase family serine peptidase [Solirubrobacteraceae bacterium]